MTQLTEQEIIALKNLAAAAPQLEVLLAAPTPATSHTDGLDEDYFARTHRQIEDAWRDENDFREENDFLLEKIRV